MREMTEADLDTVLAIEQAVQRYPWTHGQFADALKAGYWCAVDEQAGEVRGYAILMPALDEVEVLTIGIAAAQQRKGVGRALLAAMLGQARERNMVRAFLEVRPSNEAAVSLYRRMGFAEIGRRRGYYRDAAGCEDAIVMAKELEN